MTNQIPNLNDQKVVITGGSGFVGQHLVRELTASWPGAKIIVWDLPTVDILQPKTYEQDLRQLQPTWVIHLAALAAVSSSFLQPERVHEVNVVGTQRLLETIVAVTPGTRVLAVSSSDIYGQAVSDRGGTPVPELALVDCQPRNPYAASKLAMEQLIEEHFSDQCVRARPFAHIGPGQKTGFVTADFASQIAAIEVGQQPPVIKVGNLEAQRDFTDVRDVVRAYRLLLEHGTLGDVYNIASGHAVPISTILDQLLALSAQPISIEHDAVRMRPSDVPLLVGDAGKLQRETGWEVTIPLAQSLRDVLTYWREQVA